MLDYASPVMRDEFEWEKELVTVYQHVMRRRGGFSERLRLRVSVSMSMEIHSSRYRTAHLRSFENNQTWQGIPMRVDNSLPPGCFVFEEIEND